METLEIVNMWTNITDQFLPLFLKRLLTVKSKNNKKAEVKYMLTLAQRTERDK